MLVNHYWGVWAFLIYMIIVNVVKDVKVGIVHGDVVYV